MACNVTVPSSNLTKCYLIPGRSLIPDFPTTAGNDKKNFLTGLSRGAQTVSVEVQ